MADNKTNKRNLLLPSNFFVSLFGGIESGLATTTAIIAGLAITTENLRIIAVTALISLLVQAWNSAMSTISVEHTVDQLDHPYSRTDHYLKFIQDASVQFMAHVSASLVPILPIILIAELRSAVITSIVVTLVMLAWTGTRRGKLVKRSRLRSAVEAVVTGALVIAIGITAGLILNWFN